MGKMIPLSPHCKHLTVQMYCFYPARTRYILPSETSLCFLDLKLGGRMLRRDILVYYSRIYYFCFVFFCKMCNHDGSPLVALTLKSNLLKLVPHQNLIQKENHKIKVLLLMITYKSSVFYLQEEELIEIKKTWGPKLQLPLPQIHYITFLQ